MLLAGVYVLNAVSLVLESTAVCTTEPLPATVHTGVLISRYREISSYRDRLWTAYETVTANGIRIVSGDRSRSVDTKGKCIAGARKRHPMKCETAHAE